MRFFGTVTPAHNGERARIQKRLSNGAWRTVASAALVPPGPTGAGNHCDGDHAAGNSSPRDARVH